MPYYRDEAVALHLGDCREVLAAIEECSVDAVVTDPPYDLTANKKGGSGAASLNEAHPAGRSRITTGGGFMGREWDATGVAFEPETWRAVMRVMKPGGHLLAFGGTRTYHRMACAIEDAGFEIRDSLHWVYGSGFPKSLDVGKAIDKAAGAEREVIGTSAVHSRGRNTAFPKRPGEQTVEESGRAVSQDQPMLTAPATEDAARWDGWGTALKPSHEPIVVARKPLTGTVASNVLQWGTGAVNIDGCRVEGPAGSGHWIRNGEMGTNGIYGAGGQPGEDFGSQNPNSAGRWPPNFLLTHTAECNGECVPGCPVAEMDTQSGISKSSGGRIGNKDGGQIYGGGKGLAGDYSQGDPGFGDTGGASRFFPVFRYQAKAPASERPKLADGTAWPTVKPLDLMRWLVRLVTPPGGTVLDPFCGTGTTGEAAALEGFSSLLIERDPVAAELAVQRLSKPSAATLFG